MARKKRILVTGAAGMLGTALVLDYSKKYTCFALDKTIGLPVPGVSWIACDLTDELRAREAVNQANPDVIVHCVALVNVDACENNIKGAYAIHVIAAKTLADECRQRGIQIIYISTDSVFNGRKIGAYTEDDLPDPLNVYARTKLEGESVILGMNKGLVLRTNIFGWTRHGRSFAEWVLDGLRNQNKMTMFTDVLFSPVSTYCFSGVVERCIKARLNGLYHAAGRDILSKHEFALRAASIYGLPTDCIIPVKLSDAHLAAPRPNNMALNSSKLSRKLGINMPDIQTSIGMWKKFELCKV